MTTLYLIAIKVPDILGNVHHERIVTEWRHMATYIYILAYNGSGNISFPSGTKPLREPMLT